MIIDTHLHLIDLSALSYPWLTGLAALNRNFLYEDYSRDAQRAGIGAALHMEVDVDPANIEAETAYVQRLAEGPGNLITGAIAACRPESQGFADYLDRQVANKFVKGFRRVLHVMPDALSEDPLFREESQADGGNRSHLRSLCPATSDPESGSIGGPCARRPFCPRPLWRARYQGSC